jgi:N-acetylglucosaminyl-diphospho-decaprenol L-rhamnosyltransferase
VTDSLVSAVIINFEASEEDLDRCVDALERSDASNLLEIVVVDNGSRQHAQAVAKVVSRHPRARAVQLASNLGFAGGVNRGVEASRGDHVFILNNDAVVEPGAVRIASAALAEQPPACLGVIPKLLLQHHSGVLDAMGNTLSADGGAFNIGIGQLDVGQYDRPERRFGPCFAATMLRRSAFDPDVVGPLDETYFMYFEDVDWSWRANIFGYFFVTAPDSRVLHAHSATTRRFSYEYKFRHVERNLLVTTFKNAEKRGVARIFRHPVRNLVAAAVRGPYHRASVAVIAESFARLPSAARDRRAVQARRIVADAEIFGLTRDELPFFDPPTYAPMRTLANLSAMYRRKAVVTGEDRWAYVSELAAGLAARQPHRAGHVAGRLLPLLAGEPPEVHELVHAIDEAAPKWLTAPAPH